MAARADTDGMELGLVAFAAVAAGVAVAILAGFPYDGLGQRGNLVVVAMAGLVIAAAGATVAWAMFRRRPRPRQPPGTSA